MTIISNPAALAQVTAAAGILARAEAAVAATAERHTAVERRRVALETSLAEYDATRPQPDPDVSAELTELLIANPDVANSADWTGRVREHQATSAAALTAWEAERMIRAQALDRTTAEALTLADDVAAAQEAHEAAYAEFLTDAHDALQLEFETRWAAITAELLKPLAAMRRPRRLYSPDYASPPMRRHISPESVLTLVGPDEGAPGGVGRQRVFPLDGSWTGTDAVQAIERFRLGITPKRDGALR